MSSRGRRSYSHLRRPVAPLGTARAPETAAERYRPPDLFSEVDPLDELERILAAGPHQFRLQFFAVAGDHGPGIIGETEIQAPDASAAIRASADAEWPPRAIGLRILDREGREIFERLKADRR